MDGENNGKPYEQMDDLGVSLFLETPKSTKTCNSLMDCVPQVPQFLPVAIWPLVEATLHVSPGQSSMVAVIQYFHPAVVHVVLFAVALRYFTIWWITFWSTIPSEDVQWTCVALVSSSSMFMGWLSIGVFVSSEVSRREATTKLFFGFPHDCPSKLRVMPLCGSFGARKAWEDKNLQHAPNYHFFFHTFMLCFLFYFQKAISRDKFIVPNQGCPTKSLSGPGTFEHALRSLRPHIWQSGLHCKRAPVELLRCSTSSVGKLRSLSLQLQASWDVLNRFEMSKNLQKSQFSSPERPFQSKHWSCCHMLPPIFVHLGDAGTWPLYATSSQGASAKATQGGLSLKVVFWDQAKIGTKIHVLNKLLLENYRIL